MCRSYGDQFEILLKDKSDISTYLKKQLEVRNEQVFDLNDRLIGLQQAKDNEKDLFEKTLQDLKEKSQLEIEKLENDNMLLKTRLLALEEFKYQRQTMEKTIDELKNLILKKEDAYKKSLEQMEIALIIFKNRLKNEAIQYLNDLAIEFHHNTNNQISNTIKRVIHENFYLNNQIDYLSNQLEKSIEINQKYTKDNQHLTRTISILEDVQIQAAKKYLTTENIIQILSNKLKQCKEQKNNTINQMIIPTQTIDRQSFIHEEKSSQQKEESIEIKNFKEENYILKNIIHQAAISIADVVQGQHDNNDTVKIEQRNEMLEQLLSLLLTSHHLEHNGLLFKNQSPFSKGIFPGSRLGLHRIQTDSLIKTNTHYCLGDLGIVPSNIKKT